MAPLELIPREAAALNLTRRGIPLAACAVGLLMIPALRMTRAF